LDPTGLLRNIYKAALAIDSGRKGFAIIGKERKGRISYEKGIAQAMSAFKEAQKVTLSAALYYSSFIYFFSNI